MALNYLFFSLRLLLLARSKRPGPIASCQPSTSVYRPSNEHCAPVAPVQCCIWMALLRSKWIWFHCALTNGPSNNLKLSTSPHRHYFPVINNSRKMCGWKIDNKLRKLLSEMKGVMCKNKMCVCAAVHQKSDLANAKKGKTLRIT